MEQKARSDPEFAAALERAHAEYASERNGFLIDREGPVPTGGVGGTDSGVKCLHAHYAHVAAGGDNPVGSLVAAWIGPLDCTVPCVADGAPNPDWSSTP